MYYRNKINLLEDIFGTKNIILKSGYIEVDFIKYPLIDDVVILAEPDEYTDYVKARLGMKMEVGGGKNSADFAEDVQYSFGEEWRKYDGIFPEHEDEFIKYFDIVDLNGLKNKKVCDLGCGNGRWSYFLKDKCRQLILVDFSDAIFTARKNLAENNNYLFFMGDLRKLPFRNNFADFLFSLGVLHHLPVNCLDEVRRLKRFSDELLIFLYYALDNRPAHYRVILKLVTLFRVQLAKCRNNSFRKIFAVMGTYFIYLPLILLGWILRPLKLSSHVPLYDFYHNRTLKRIQQDVYDRFFTSIEQRVSRMDIMTLKDTFSSITVSDNIPYWHFLCES